MKIFVGESDLSILELKKEVINEKFKSVHLFQDVFTGNGKQSSLKGQIISECPYEIIVYPKIATKKFLRFLP